MTTPTDNTAQGVIKDAMRDAGLLQAGDDPSPEQYAENMRRLRDQVNFLQTQGLKLWVNEDITVPLVAAQADYTFKPSGNIDMTKPLRVLEGFYLYDTTNVRRPLSQISLRDYWQLGMAGEASSNQGTITQFLVEKQLAQLKVTFWLCPDTDEAADGEVHLLMQTQITNASELDEQTYFPPEWRIALRWNLAKDICTGQPQAVIDRCEKWAEFYRAQLEGWDVEDAPTSFQPDPRMMMNTGRFR